MQDIIVALILILMIAAAVRYIYKAKKSGAKCIGCSASGCCTSKRKKTESYTITPEIEAAFPLSYMIGVEGMTCQNCAKYVEQAFFEKGYLCKVDLKREVAEVRSRQPVEESVLGQIVTDAGYGYVKQG